MVRKHTADADMPTQNPIKNTHGSYHLCQSIRCTRAHRSGHLDKCRSYLYCRMCEMTLHRTQHLQLGVSMVLPHKTGYMFGRMVSVKSKQKTPFLKWSGGAAKDNGGMIVCSSAHHILKQNLRMAIACSPDIHMVHEPGT